MAMVRTAGQAVRSLGKRVINAVPPARSIWRRVQHVGTLSRRPTVDHAIDTATARWPGTAPPEGERPIFLLSSGWRCGSTLLQRLLMSAGNAMLWGEPYHRCSMTQRMAESVRAITPQWPADGVFLAGDNGDVPENTYLANLFPRPTHFAAAHRAFFDRLFAVPARERGFERWGIKETRLTAAHARYLGWIYPDARFVFVVRDPYAAYRSYRMFRPWYVYWPHKPVLTAAEFGGFWKECAKGFIAQDAAGRGLLVRFESLTSGGYSIDPLNEHVDLELNAAILERRMMDRRWRLQPVPAGELRDLRDAVDPLAEELGYRPPA